MRQIAPHVFVEDIRVLKQKPRKASPLTPVVFLLKVGFLAILTGFIIG